MNSGNALGRTGSALSKDATKPPLSSLCLQNGCRSQELSAQDREQRPSLHSWDHLFPEFTVLRFPLGVRHNALSEDHGCSVTFYCSSFRKQACVRGMAATPKLLAFFSHGTTADGPITFEKYFGLEFLVGI